MRVKSETRQPGMISERRCLVCRELLDLDDDVRCFQCSPHLNGAAQSMSIERAELRQQEQAIHLVELSIKRLEKVLRDGQHSDQRHRGHTGKATDDLETDR